MTEERTPLTTFTELFRTLVVRFQPRPFEKGTVEAYHEVLGEFDACELKASATTLSQAGHAFFPSTGEWYQAARLVRQETYRALAAEKPVNVTVCAKCEDTGSVFADCPGDHTCGRRYLHPSHGFVVVCACRPTNREYQRRNAAAALRKQADG